jgi:hypothetical protein
MNSRLPTRPDFESIETAALESADRRTRLLALIGNLSFSWSNNESMFIYVLMLLLDVDEVAAAIVFSTLNTTRARLDLIQRLAVIRIARKEVREDLEALIERFTAATRLRNEFNHAMFMLDEHGDITHTQSLRIVEQRGRFKFGETRKVDKERIDEMYAAIRDMRDLNRDLWDFLPRLQGSVASRGGT